MTLNQTRLIHSSEYYDNPVKVTDEKLDFLNTESEIIIAKFKIAKTNLFKSQFLITFDSSVNLICNVDLLYLTLISHESSKNIVLFEVVPT